jgi:hypothetical protein
MEFLTYIYQIQVHSSHAFNSCYVPLINGRLWAYLTINTVTTPTAEIATGFHHLDKNESILSSSRSSNSMLLLPAIIAHEDSVGRWEIAKLLYGILHSAMASKFQ